MGAGLSVGETDVGKLALALRDTETRGAAIGRLAVITEEPDRCERVWRTPGAAVGVATALREKATRDTAAHVVLNICTRQSLHMEVVREPGLLDGLGTCITGSDDVSALAAICFLSETREALPWLGASATVTFALLSKLRYGIPGSKDRARVTTVLSKVASSTPAARAAIWRAEDGPASISEPVLEGDLGTAYPWSQLVHYLAQDPALVPSLAETPLVIDRLISLLTPTTHPILSNALAALRLICTADNHRHSYWNAPHLLSNLTSLIDHDPTALRIITLFASGPPPAKRALTAFPPLIDALRASPSATDVLVSLSALPPSAPPPVVASTPPPESESGTSAATQKTEVETEEEEGVDGGEGGGEGAHMCGVCLAEPKSALFADCGHMVCMGCADSLRSRNLPCPMCRKPITKVIRAYLS